MVSANPTTAVEIERDIEKTLMLIENIRSEMGSLGDFPTMDEDHGIPENGIENEVDESDQEETTMPFSELPSRIAAVIRQRVVKIKPKGGWISGVCCAAVRKSKGYLLKMAWDDGSFETKHPESFVRLCWRSSEDHRLQQ